jgi:hypothetical protein
MPDALIWPAIVAICIILLGVVAIFALRPALLRLVDRTAKISRDGAIFERPQEDAKRQKPVASFEEIIKLPVSPTVLDREEKIKQNLQAIPLKSDAERIAVLIKASAVSRVEMEFINISNLIFGSQLNLLARLVGTPAGIPYSDAEAIFKQAQADSPDLHGKRTLDEWLRYLLNSNVITAQNNRIDITQYGKDFLKYLVDARLAYQRHG